MTVMAPSRQAISPLRGAYMEEVNECHYYLLYEEIQVLLVRLTHPAISVDENEDDFEHPIISFWSHLLRLPAYFRQPSARDLPGTGLWFLYETPVLHEILQDDEHTDWTVLTVSRYGRGKQTGRTTKLVSIGRLLDLDESAAEEMWSKGISKLDQYLEIIAAQPEQQEEPIYGIIAIGNMSRFYEAKTSTSRWSGVPAAGRTFHLAEDEESIHLWLSKWAQESRQGAVIMT